MILEREQEEKVGMSPEGSPTLRGMVLTLWECLPAFSFPRAITSGFSMPEERTSERLLSLLPFGLFSVHHCFSYSQTWQPPENAFRASQEALVAI